MRLYNRFDNGFDNRLYRVNGALEYAQSHSITESLWGTQTDRRSADFSIDHGKALPQSASCLHGSHAVDVVARRGRGISWFPSHGMRSTLQMGYSSSPV